MASFADFLIRCSVEKERNMTILIPDIAWCEVPAGEFIMGSDNHNNREKPQHTVNLPYTYHAAKYPVTNAQYQPFVDAGGYSEQRYWTVVGWEWKKWEKRTAPRPFSEPFNLSNHPVVGVSWHEAVAFCHWLTEVMREHGKLAEGWLIRLPTEAEWEKAARGTDGRVYPWGNEFDLNKANGGDESEIRSTSAVGFFPKGKSPYGCQDMAGNVWEWCATKRDGGYKPYPYQIEDEWTEAYLEGDSYRVSRGGSWNVETDYLRCAYRINFIPYGNFNYRGFRCFSVPIF